MKPKPQSPVRQALAMAIAHRGEAERAHASAVAAQADARDRLWAAETALEEATSVLSSARPNVTSFASGAGADLAELDRPIAEANAAVTASEREVHRWRAVLEALPGVVTERAADINRAHRDVDRAVQAVLEAEAPAVILAALDGLEDLIAEVQRRSFVLMALAQLNAVPPEHRAVVVGALRSRGGNILPCADRTSAFIPSGYEAHPVVKAWRNAVVALKHDATAPLPGASG